MTARILTPAEQLAALEECCPACHGSGAVLVPGGGWNEWTRQYEYDADMCETCQGTGVTS